MVSRRVTHLTWVIVSKWGGWVVGGASPRFPLPPRWICHSLHIRVKNGKSLLVGAMWVSFESASSSSVGNKDRSHSDWPKKFPPNKLLFSTFRNVLNFIIRLCGPTVKVPIHSCVRCVFISLSFQLGRDTKIKNKKPFGRKNNIFIPSSSSSDSRSCPVVHSEDLKKVFFFFFWLFFSLK